MSSTGRISVNFFLIVCSFLCLTGPAVMAICSKPDPVAWTNPITRPTAIGYGMELALVSEL